MSSLHPSEENLELYVSGRHEEISVETIEAHLASCASCSKEVAELARFELTIEGLAPRLAYCPDCQAVLADARCLQCGVNARPSGFVVDEVLVKSAHGRVYLAHDAL